MESKPAKPVNYRPIAEKTLNRYAHQWGANAIPFTGELDNGFYPAACCQSVHESLSQCAALKSVMLLSGANGTGKTLLVRQWMERLDPKAFLPVALTQATLSGTGLLAYLTGKLGKHASLLRARNLVLLEEAFAEMAPSTCVLILDEAQNYTHAALEEVRLLSGLALSPAAFALILVGDDYLLGTLRLRSHRALYSRIAIHLSLQPWPADEIEALLCHHLAAVGIERDIFEPAALEMLTSAAEGVPRTALLLARAAWIFASSQKEQAISSEHLQSALKTVPAASLKTQPLTRHPKTHEPI